MVAEERVASGSWAAQEQRAEERRYPTFKVRSTGREDIPHVKGKQQWLCWSSHEEIPYVQGMRNPSKMVGAERGHQRADRLKLQSQTTSQSNRMDHSLV